MTFNEMVKQSRQKKKPSSAKDQEAVTFKDAVGQTPHLKGTWRAGLGALRAEDKPHLKADDTRHLRGSSYVDEALKHVKGHEQAHRWDFAIAYQHSNCANECIYWTELHTASTSQVNVVLDKLRWLKMWLRGDGKVLAEFECDFVWVSSGSTHYTLSAPQKKAFSQLGLRQCGETLRIRDKR